MIKQFSPRGTSWIGISAFIAGLAIASPVMATVVTYTSSADFTAALSGMTVTTENYGSYAVGQPIANGTVLGGLTYTFSAGPLGSLQQGGITNLYNDFSGNSLGGSQSSSENFFFGGDGVTIVFPTQIYAVGVFFNVNLNSGSYTIDTSVGSVSADSLSYDVETFVFSGIVSTTPFTSISFYSTDSQLGSYNIPAVLYATQGAPEPVTLALFGAGLAGMGAMRKRRLN